MNIYFCCIEGDRMTVQKNKSLTSETLLAAGYIMLNRSIIEIELERLLPTYGKESS